MKKRVFLKTAGTAGLWRLLSVSGQGETAASARIAECKRLYPDVKTIAAYEYFTAGRGKGRGAVEGIAQVQVGQHVPQVEVVYKADCAIARGGMVKLWCPNGATRPQLDSPDKPGYMKINAPVAFHAALSRLSYWKMYDIRRESRFVDVTLPDGLTVGGAIRFVWKNVTVDQRAGRFDGDRWVFQVAVDHDADGFAELIPDPPSVPKLAGPAVRLLARVSSTAVIGEPVRLNVCAFDRYDNPATGFQGAVRIEGADLPQSGQIVEHGAGECEVRFSKPGFYWLTVRSADGSMVAESNPVEVFAEDPGVRLYWGDIHVHTEMSADARAGADTTSTYAGSYKIGRVQYALDFQANTDHQGSIQGNYGADDWEEMCRITNEANQPGKFVALHGAELSCNGGDQNVYFPGNVAPFLDHDPRDRNAPPKTWSKLDGMEAITIPHHFAGSMRPWEWSMFNPERQPVVELFSNHGRAEYPGNDPHYCWHGTPTVEGKTWVEQLNAGKKLGALASSDDHWARPGTCGLTGVWAPSLTRRAVYEEMKCRRCYATTTDRVILHFHVNDAGMGETIRCSEPPRIRIRAAAPGRIEKVEIVRNGEAVYRMAPQGRIAEFEWTDAACANGYYYVRLSLAAQNNVESSMKKRQQFVWSSPVWIEKEQKEAES